MAHLENASINFATWPLYFAGAIFLLGVLIGKNKWLRHSNIDESSNDVSASRTPQTVDASTLPDAPTIRISDSQRVDRLHRVVSLVRGEHVDLLDLTFDRIPRLRITFEGFDSLATIGADETVLQSHEYARVHVELGGAIAGCGSLVREVGVNQFLLPRATSDEHRCSILHFHGKGEMVNFLRIKLVHLNASQQTIEIDILHVCGSWSSATHTPSH